MTGDNLGLEVRGECTAHPDQLCYIYAQAQAGTVWSVGWCSGGVQLVQGKYSMARDR